MTLLKSILIGLLATAGTDCPAVETGNVTVKRMRVTAYCSCKKCCGKDANGITACNHKILPGDKFVAADKSIPFGTRIFIPGYCEHPVEVLDRGGAIKGDRLDLYFGDKDGMTGHERAMEWGVKYLEVKIYGVTK